MTVCGTIPELCSDRLTLRAPCGDDAAAYADFYADAEASRFYGGPLGQSAAWHRLAANLGHWALRGYGVWVIERTARKGCVGTAGLIWPDGWPRPELTWWIAPAARRRGIAAEASRMVIRWALTNGWTRIETHMKDENLPARALVTSLGGIRVAREAFPDGATRDVFSLPET